MPKRVLIVDDDRMVCNLLETTFSKAGYETAIAYDGDEALKALRNDPFDLTITDVVMPGMSGLELLKAIHRDHPDTRVVILTGHPRQHDISDFLLHGAEDYVVKPFRTEELLSLVARVLEEESVADDGAEESAV